MSTMDTANAARGRWPSILQALGVDPKFLRNEHGPCPHCGGKDRFRFDDRLNGSFFCSHCGNIALQLQCSVKKDLSGQPTAGVNEDELCQSCYPSPCFLLR